MILAKEPFIHSYHSSESLLYGMYRAYYMGNSKLHKMLFTRVYVFSWTWPSSVRIICNCHQIPFNTAHKFNSTAHSDIWDFETRAFVSVDRSIRPQSSSEYSGCKRTTQRTEQMTAQWTRNMQITAGTPISVAQHYWPLGGSVKVEPKQKRQYLIIHRKMAARPVIVNLARRMKARASAQCAEVVR